MVIPYIARLGGLTIVAIYLALLLIGVRWAKRKAGFMGATAFVFISAVCLGLSYSTLQNSYVQLEASYLYQENSESNFSNVVSFVLGLVIAAVGLLISFVVVWSMANERQNGQISDWYERSNARRPGVQFLAALVVLAIGTLMMLWSVFQDPWSLTTFVVFLVSFALTTGGFTWAYFRLLDIVAKPSRPNQ